MIVVSDTSPLNYLILTGTEHVLPVLFGHVYVPHRVAQELADPTAPPAVRGWIAARPPWLVVRTPINILHNLGLDPGEVHALSLAEELRADHVLIDEWAARAVAAERGLHVVGTLGVLDQAAERNLIDLRPTLERLLLTNFRIDRRLVDRLIEHDAKRKDRDPR